MQQVQRVFDWRALLLNVLPPVSGLGLPPVSGLGLPLGIWALVSITTASSIP